MPIARLLNPKKAGKLFLCFLLERQVRNLRRRYDFKVIAVAGSIGKTSTKVAIAQTLSVAGPVQYEHGNYNDRLTVPLVFFGQTTPNLFNLLAWLKLLAANQRILKQPYPYNYVVIELGTDGPGQLHDFAYLKPDLSIVTAVAPEHMEYFIDLNAVATEELTVLNYSDQVLINIDNVAVDYLKDRQFKSYGSHERADFRIIDWQDGKLSGGSFKLVAGDGGELELSTQVVGRQGASITAAAAATASILGLKADQIRQGTAKIEPLPGRMQILPGIKESLLIDDAYNASPAAVLAALDVLYACGAPQKIAILGSMNELGQFSPQAHEEVGHYCQPDKLDMVVTIGQEAERYLAAAASQAGCKVISFANPYEAGQFVAQQIKNGAAVLAKGSQNGVFAEEALKALLRNSEDQNKLVRQSAYWLKIKRRQFGDS